MRMNKWAKGLTVSVMVFGMFMAWPMEASASELPKGIYVGDQDLGGLTREEAEKAVEDYVNSMAGQKVTLDVDGSLVDTTAEALGFHWSNTEAIDETVSAYEGGNLLRRFMNLIDLERNPVTLQLETSMDEGKVAAFVEAECSSLTADARDAVITRENGEFVVTPSVIGKKVDVEATKQALDTALAGGLSEPVHVTAVIEEAHPAVTTEMLSSIQDVLGTFTTSFSSSGASRSTNIRVGSGKINGHVLMPGEVLSGYECMQPFTTANGYATAAAYENGQVIDSVGGGVCQISTTLYNAALLSELDIVQRQNHSMIVTYVKPSCDAAIAGTYKDIKVANPYDTPIYIEGGTSGKTVTFTVYGKETRPANRTIKFVSETLGTTDPGEPITQLDPTLAPGARVRVQSSHTGYRSRLWKYVYVDGVETEREILHTDTYNASKAIYRVGPEAPPATEPVPAETPAETAPAEVGPGVGPGFEVPPVPETEAGPGAPGV